MDSGDAKSSGGKIAIIVALIGLLGTLLPVLIVNWKNIFPESSSTSNDTASTRPNRVDILVDTIRLGGNTNPDASVSKISNNQNTEAKKVPNAINPAATNNISNSNAVKKLGRQWDIYLNARNVDGLIKMSSLPFFGDRIINEYASLTGYYNRLSVNNSLLQKPDNIIIINKSDFYNMFPQLKNLINLSTKPYVVQISVDNKEIFLLLQEKIDTLKIVGCFVN